MATIPDSMDMGERVVARRRVPITDNRGPEIEAAALGNAAERIGQRVQQFAAHDDQFNAGIASAKLKQKSAEIEKELESDPDFESHESKYLEKMNAERQEAAKTIKGERSRALFDQDAQADIARGSQQVFANAKTIEGQWGRGTLTETLDANRRTAIEAKTPEAREALMLSTMEAIDGAVAKRYISPEQAVLTRKAWAQNYAEDFIGALPAADQVAALKDPKNQEARIIDPAKRAGMLKLAEHNASVEKVESASNAIVKAFEVDTTTGQAALKELDKSDLSDEDKFRVRSQVRQGQGLIHAERRQEFAEQVNALERRIASGVPGPNAELDAKALYRKGVYTPEQFTNVLQSIDGARVKGATDAAIAASIREALAGGERLDPRNDKIVDGVDKLFIQATTDNHMAPGTDEWINGAAGIAAKTNILPPEAMSWARKNLLSGDPKLSVPAANAMARWSDAAPAAYTYFDDANMKAFAEQLDGFTRAGMKPEEATKQAHDNVYTMPKERRDRLDAQYKKEKYAADNPSQLQSRLNSDDSFDRALLGGAPAAPTMAGVGARAMADEYELLVRSYYDKTNGDVTAARDLAWKDIRGTYGYSTVNGAPEILKYAPELEYPGIDVNVIRSDAVEAAKQLGVESNNVRLVPNTKTGRTRGLEWELHYTDADGFEDVVLGPDNRPARYEIPTDTARYLAAQEDAKRKSVDAARTESKRRREFAEIDALVEQSLSIN